MAEATHLTCTVYVKNFDEQCRLFGEEGFGFKLIREFGSPGNLRGRYFQTGAGFIEVVEDPNNPVPFWDFILSVEDVEPRRNRLVEAGYAPSEVFDMPGGRSGFEVQGPSGVGLRVRSLVEADTPLVYATEADQPNVIHFIITWWPEDWDADYRFLSEGLDLVTSRGRNEAGRSIAFMRGAYEGRGIVEVIDRANSPYSSDGLHWRIGIMVDDAATFHERLKAGGHTVTDLEVGRLGWPAFTAGTPAGPEIIVAQIPEGTMSGLLGEPDGLGMP